MAGQFYTIQVRTKVITVLLNLNTQDQFIKIIPVVHGNFFPILLGAGALFGASAITAGTFLGSTLLVNALTAVGTSMLIGGVTQMLSPQQNNLSPTGQGALGPAALASNYSFTGLTNISEAGIPVNLVYGSVVGSIVVSNGVDYCTSGVTINGYTRLLNYSF